MKSAMTRAEELRRALRDRDREIEELQSLVAEFNRIKPKSGELAEISSLISRMESVEELRIASSGALNALDNEEGGANQSLARAKRLLSSAKSKDEILDEFVERIDNALVEINELNRELSRYLEGLAADPRSLDELLNRRAGLIGFAKRFGEGVEKTESYESAVKRGESARTRISDLSGGDGRLAQIEAEVGEKFRRVEDFALRLSKLRKQAAVKLAKQVVEELAQLSMPHSRFEVSVDFTAPNLKEIPGQFGCDEVEMRFSAHSDGELLPIGKSASGGELSRLMLALEVAIAGKRSVGAYLFDEVDAGIGGKTALEVGRRLKKLASSAQVIVVTHLPQVAIWADNHLRVIKDSSGSITESSIEVIDGEARETEIARMLSGLSDSEHAQEHARELLDLGRSSNS
jgi:DNA repair protein RecN (Recombination protein N)